MLGQQWDRFGGCPPCIYRLCWHICIYMDKKQIKTDRKKKSLEAKHLMEIEQIKKEVVIGGVLWRNQNK